MSLRSEEVIDAFDCFGARCSVFVIGAGTPASARQAVALARCKLLDWHARFSRFLPGSELSRVNADPRAEVHVSRLMARLAQAIHDAGSLTDGLVDGTLVDQLERVGYTVDLCDRVPLATALAYAPARRPARGAPTGGWCAVRADSATSTITRPPGVKLDSGGLAKGLFADVLAAGLAAHPGFAINCAGDVAVGGTASVVRPIHVESPFDGRTLHTFHLRSAGVATSGIGRRSWLDAHGRPAHHLLDPARGEPAFTGVVQVTALAPSALLAEIRAKAALLGGPCRARSWLLDGGVIVFDDGAHEVLEPPPVITLSELSAFAQRTTTHTAEAA